MSLSKLVAKVSVPQQKKKQECIIPLLREQEEEIPKNKRIMMKLRSNPSQADSQVYEIVTRAFDHGTPEEWIRHRRTMSRILIGQNITSGPDKFRMIRRLLEGKALADFEASVTTHNYNETANNLESALNDVAIPIFPKQALQKQRRTMRRQMKKPVGLPVAHYWARLVELNGYLPDFPTGTDQSKISDDDLKEVLEFGIPEVWRMHMKLTRFEPTNESAAEIVSYCRDLEGVEAEHGNLDVMGVYEKQRRTKKDPPGFSLSKTTKRSAKKRNRKNYEENNFTPCPIHPHGKHSMADCRTLKKLREESQTKFDGKSKFNRNKNNYSSRSNKPSEEEVNVLVEQYLTTRLFPKKNVGCKRRPRRSIKWRNPLTKEVKTTAVAVSQCENTTEVVETTVDHISTTNENTSKSENNGQTDKSIEDELNDFNDFTIGDEDPTSDDMNLEEFEDPDKEETNE